MDPELFNQINNDVTNRYRKDKNSAELLSIQDFLDNINNEDITNKDDACKEIKNLKNDVKRDELKDIVKELERAIFGNEELSGSGLKILTNKQMLNRLPIFLAQIQAGNNSIKLKNEIKQILYSLHRSKVLTKTVYINLIKSICSKNLCYARITVIKMETFFMNSKNSKTNEPNRFKYDLIDKLDLKNPNKNMAFANLSIYYTWKNVKSTYNNNKFKISAPT